MSKSHKSVEKLESENLEDAEDDFLSGKRSYASKPGEKLRKNGIWSRRQKRTKAKSKREKVEEKQKKKRKLKGK